MTEKIKRNIYYLMKKAYFKKILKRFPKIINIKSLYFFTVQYIFAYLIAYLYYDKSVKTKKLLKSKTFSCNKNEKGALLKLT